MKKKLLSILVVLAMVVAMLPAMTMTAFAEVTKPDDAKWLVNEENNHVWYKLEDSNKKLIIGGEGAMPDYESFGENTPWKNNKRTINTIVIQSGVTCIGKNAFCEISNLISVTIPSSVISIGEDAFSNSFAAKSTANLYIDDIASWCNITFGNVSSNPYGTTRSIDVRNVYVGDSDTPITELVIPDGVTSIPNYAFYQWKQLIGVTIPSSVTSIGVQAFQGCSGLEGKSVTIPSSVTSIENNAFQSCKLGSVNVKAINPLTTLGSNSTLGYGTSAVKKIYVPYGTVEAYKNATYWSNYKAGIEGAYFVDVARTEGGKVTVDKDCFPVADYTEAKDTVNVIIKPNEGYKLKALKYNDGTDHDITDEGNGYQFIMPLANVTVKAEFELIPQPHNVTAQVQGSHGSATLKIGEAEATTASQAVKDTSIAFTATPDSGYEFDYWEVVSGGIPLTDTDKVKPTLTVTMPDTALTLKAHFKAIIPSEYNIIVEDDGHGSAIAKVGDAKVTEAAPDTEVTLVATPAEGYVFKEWVDVRGNAGTFDKTNKSTTLTMPKAEIKVKATFERVYNINIQVNGKGTLTARVAGASPVTSAKAGVSVTLIPEAKEGYEFDKFEIVSGSFDIDKEFNYFIMPTSDVTVKAIFKLAKPEITKGDNQTVKAGAKEGVTVTSNAPFDTFKKVLVDGKEITKDKDFTVKEGSTIVTLKPEYVSTLKAGKHKVEIVSEGGTAIATFTLTEADAPTTGDSNNMLLWSLLLALSIIGLGVGAYYKSVQREE